MPDEPQESPATQRYLGLRWADQLAAALVIGAALVLVGVYYSNEAMLRGRIIDIDRATPQPVQFQLDINTAQVPELLLLPEIGESMAERIVDERTANGPFRGIGDLRRVRGIGPKTLEQIRPFLLPIEPPVEVAE
jgi:competence protein ComEA